MKVEVLGGKGALEGLVPEWAALWPRTAAASPFQHPAWMMAWWEAFGTDRPLVATVREGGRLVGVYPAYVLSEAGGDKLLPIGAGTTDYLDSLGVGGEVMLGALLNRAALEGVGRAALLEVPPGSGLLGFMGVAGWRGAWSEGAACPVLRVSEVPAGMRRKLRMSRHRAERAGGWSVDNVGVEGLDLLAGLHAARWSAAGVLADPAVMRCLRLALPGFERAGLLRLMVLRVGGAAASAVLALLGTGRIFFYASGYDTGQAFVSPGTLLIGAMLDQAAAEGRGEAHFLRGREEYKYRWGAVDRFNQHGEFWRAEDERPAPPVPTGSDLA